MMTAMPASGPVILTRFSGIQHDPLVRVAHTCRVRGALFFRLQVP